MAGLPFFDDVRGEFGRVAAADVPHRVDRSGRDGQGVPGVTRPRRLSLDLILQRPFEDVDDLFARMGVPDRWCFGADLDRCWTTSRPGTLRSCCCSSVRHSPAPCWTLPLAPLLRSSVVLIAASPWVVYQ